MGIDYTDAVERAVAGNPARLATLLRFTDSAGVDGAAGEGHCAILFGLLQRWGDAPFSRVLRAQNRAVRKAVCGAIVSFPYFRRAEFPQTYAAARH